MNRKQKTMLGRILVSAALLISLGFVPVTGVSRFICYMAAYLVIGYDILIKAGRGILNRQVTDENFLMAVATIGAIALAKARGERRSLPGCRAAGKCGLGAGRFAAIAPDGALYACQELCSYGGGPFLIGSVFTGADEARRRALMALYDSAPARGGGCEGCAYDPVCDGGCAASNFLVTGEVNRVPETYCRWKRLLLAEAERIKGKEAEG